MKTYYSKPQKQANQFQKLKYINVIKLINLKKILDKKFFLIFINDFI